jgi:uncharacterized protein YjiS (DUF1127 family)
MAYENTIRVSSPSFAERIRATVAAIRLNMGRRALYRQTKAELLSLSDRELADLGIHPSDIDHIAREASFGV